MKIEKCNKMLKILDLNVFKCRIGNKKRVHFLFSLITQKKWPELMSLLLSMRLWLKQVENEERDIRPGSPVHAPSSLIREVLPQCVRVVAKLYSIILFWLTM